MCSYIFKIDRGFFYHTILSCFYSNVNFLNLKYFIHKFVTSLFIVNQNNKNIIHIRSTMVCDVSQKAFLRRKKICESGFQFRIDSTYIRDFCLRLVFVNFVSNQLALKLKRPCKNKSVRVLR